MNGFLKDENGKELLVLGMQAHNSSTGTFMMERTIRAAQLYGQILWKCLFTGVK